MSHRIWKKGKLMCLFLGSVLLVSCAGKNEDAEMVSAPQEATATPTEMFEVSNTDKDSNQAEMKESEPAEEEKPFSGADKDSSQAEMKEGESAEEKEPFSDADKDSSQAEVKESESAEKEKPLAAVAKPVAWDPNAVATSNYITFGHYEQDNNPNNGTEPIEWRILKEEDGKVLLLSRYGLDAKVYHQINSGVTWEISTLREWLNTEFYDTAFDGTEKEAIILSLLENDDNTDAWPHTEGGNATEDYVFLLSKAEAEENLQISTAAEATEYALAQGIVNGTTWLRSPGGAQNAAQVIRHESGIIDTKGDYTYMVPNAVRPAIWVEKTSEIAEQMTTDTKIIGSYVTFGHYEQNSTLDGAEPMEWQVIDVRDGKALLLSKVEFKSISYNDDKDKDWKSSSMRSWLQREFYDTAFQEKEKEYIVLTQIKPLSNEFFGASTLSDSEDYVFLLSCNEVMSYFSGGASPYQFGVMSLQNDGFSGWLRDCKFMLQYDKFGSLVRNDTLHFYAAVNMVYNTDHRILEQPGVKPAMWVELSVLDSDYASLSSQHTEVSSVIKMTDPINGYVEFGRYEQDNDMENGPEPIEWLILEQTENELLLISRYGLEGKEFNDGRDDYHDIVTWDQCTLRAWLNNEFYQTAFNEEERAYLQLNEIISPGFRIDGQYIYYDCVTEDYVYVLHGEYSYSDLKLGGPTKYAYAQTAAMGSVARIHMMGSRNYLWASSCEFDNIGQLREIHPVIRVKINL